MMRYLTVLVLLGTWMYGQPTVGQNILKKRSTGNVCFETMYSPMYNNVLRANLNILFDTSLVQPKVDIGSITVMHNAGKTFVSSNFIPVMIFPGLFRLAAKEDNRAREGDTTQTQWSGILFPLTVVSGLGELVHCLSNIKVRYGLYRQLSVYAGQSTNFFLFYNPARIHTQTALGIDVKYKRVYGIVEYWIPWNKGYRSDRKPSISLGIGLKLLPI